jgi:uncharacterized membrane-anchored protein
MPRFRAFLMVCMLLAGLTTQRGTAQALPTETGKTPEQREQAKFEALMRRVRAIKPGEGKISLPEANATIQLKDNYRFINRDDALLVLGELWRNPREVLTNVSGMIVPTGFDPTLEESWCVVVSYEKCGFVKDDDASEIDAGKLLTAFREYEEEENVQRKKRGYEPMWTVDWAESPHYDKSRHIIFWAKRLSSEKSGTARDTLNYDARCLGRRGLLSLNALAEIKRLPEIRKAMEEVIPQAKFNTGETYADFDSSSDHVAEYTVLGLVAAGAAAKLVGKGAFLLIILKFGKFLLIPLIFCWKYVASAARWVWELVTGKRADNAMAAKEVGNNPDDHPGNPPAS